MRFLVTNELGKLARWLRIMGYDAVYVRTTDTASLVLQALREERIIITRTRRVTHLKKRTVVVRATEAPLQLKEVAGRLALEADSARMFSRCPVCNSQLLARAKESVRELVPEYVYEHYDRFMYCPECNKAYWQGTHWGNVSKVIHQMLG